MTDLSLDHDLGNNKRGTGYNVLVWLEKQVVMHDFPMPNVILHTADPAGRISMQKTLNSIDRFLWWKYCPGNV